MSAFFLPVIAGDTPPLDGYSAAASQAERDWESKFRALPSAQNQRDYMQLLSARPHHVGSAYDKKNAEWILARFKEWGWDAQIEHFDVLFPTPKRRVVELIAPTHFAAALQEPPVAADPTSNQQAEQLPTYNAYSADGDVSAPLVYVNYGLPADYEQLDRLGVSVKGAIVIARYGNSWRGIKPKVAAEHGAVGCLIYSDPRDDGYFQGDVFPVGGLRNKDGVQRGSMMDFASNWPGDPTTPDREDKTIVRLAAKDAPSITKIPVLPISYGDAQPLLAAIGGPLAPADWRGALPIPYHVGPGPAKVHLAVESNWDIKPLYDVIARIPGAADPDTWIVRGNHHDAWVNGAEDPVSGQVALLEEARALGELLKQGWKPRRTIIYCAWDGEEPMLLGSTAWAETHAAELRRHAAVYINTDASGRGFFAMEGSHTLEHFTSGVIRDIEDPESKLSVFERNRRAAIAFTGKDDERKELRSRADLRLEALGSGTDYTTFIDHLGIASLNLGYGGEDEGGIYHSIYDSFYWFTHFSDTDFAYGRALSQTVGTAVMRLADAEALPFEFTGLADTVHKYTDQLKALLKSRQDEIAERNRQLEEGAFRAALDPRKPTVAPPKEDVPPHLNFAPLENAAAALTRAAEAYQKAMNKARAGGAWAGADLAALNQQLIESERRLLDPAGLPRRPWYRHVLYAPGVYTGYSPKTVAGVREAIEQKRWTEADEQIARVAQVLEGEAALINSAAALVDAWR
ncbi:MAG TPA: transferrin receptor-like dimerization domain-containing protein [Candidatus Acidoferrales bacterium]|nr:transferrin receptor-like dimerization domain-containing protein [Candidatus Acidoferrales bacterium]